MKNAVINWFKIKRAPPVISHTRRHRASALAHPVPISAELFSADQMERFGGKLALSHKLSGKKLPYYLLKRLDDNEKVLTRSCLILSSGEKAGITPAGEWLLDNFYLIEEQIRLVRQLLPKNFGKGLPSLGLPHSCPRIYDIATEVVSHSDGLWDIKTLTRFLSTYQSVRPLTLGELWAFPGMLRLALIENLRRVSIEVANAQQERNLADFWVNKLQDSAENDPASQIIVIADMARTNPPRSSAFVAELVRRLQGHGSMLALPLTWVEQRLSEVGLTQREVIDKFNQQLAASQLSVSNSIMGLRQLTEMDWAEFAENLSVVEKVLREDPAGIYASMHFDTRDNYRHQIEQLSRHSLHDEAFVASRAVALAQQATDSFQQQHVGYYLIDAGRKTLEKDLQVRFSLQTRIRSRLSQTPLLSWLGSLLLLTTAITAEVLYHTVHPGMHWAWWLLLGPVVLVASQFALNLLSEITTRSRTPQPLPRLEFVGGIPEHASTLVVIPCLLGSRKNIDALISSLEVCYLGNVLSHLNFALLTDFHDNPEQHNEDNDALLSYATQQIQTLNRRYTDAQGPLFTLLHRDSEMNAAQSVWMGYERKRGKLNALNRWLRGEGEPFSRVEGRTQAQLRQVKYVITLDSDTVLPRATAHQLVAAMAHPLNHPVYDTERQRVISGYAILQPRLAEEIPENGQGRYAALCSSVPGNDPYSSMSSDIYQDLFGEGSFVGKGIYDVDMFIRATENTCPENLVLSHDLLEGCYARSGMLSDVVLYEQYPDHYLADVARKTRWIRGDWQLLNWLGFRVTQEDGTRTRNPLTTLSRWKLFDNLRRSLIAPALLTLIFCTLLLVPNKLYWLGFIASMLLFPVVVALVLDLFNKGSRRKVIAHLKSVASATLSRCSRILLQLMTLPHEAVYSIHAILLTLWRLNVSHRMLHEWASVNIGEKSRAHSQVYFYRRMWANLLAGVAVIILAAGAHPPLLWFALPLGLLWLVAPLVMCWMSRPAVRQKPGIDAQQQRFLRQTARETWYFFETFVNAEENWLPPDNFQEIPQPVIAHRTSPTNISLSLLANITAWDFGYITQGEVLERTSQTLDTLDKLEHFRGHLYNWYDTRTLAPLNPRYISSVDSGNLAGHLLTLSSGLRLWRTQPALNMTAWLAGLADTLNMAESQTDEPLMTKLRESLKQATAAKAAESITYLQDMHGLIAASAQGWQQRLATQLATGIKEWSDFYGALPAEAQNQPLPTLHWLAQQDARMSPLLSRTIGLARQRLDIIGELEQRLNEHAHMDFRFLYDKNTHLLTVGYNCDAHKMDSGKYDLLPSEIRLTNYVTIATNQLPQKSWFALGRLFTVIDKQPSLMSWSGSMFEYLMPQLVMPAYPDTLLVQMCQTAVDRQIAWGKENNVPWGISESAYAAFDLNQNYQYHAFGVPGLGLKRGLGEDMVVAPYATMMALMIRPQEACVNLLELENCGARGEYGFYDALDYSPSRLVRGQIYIVVRSYMAHHQGMGFLALANVLLGAPMTARFAANAAFQSARLLLQERVPDAVELYSPRRHFESHDNMLQKVNVELREFTDVDSPSPEIQLLSNTHYHLMVTQAGGSVSRWKDLTLTRWREDATRDNRGIFCYVSDPESGAVTSNTWQPLGKQKGTYHAVLTDFGAEFTRTRGLLTLQTHIVVSPEDDVEIRRMTVTHNGRHSRTLDITTYAEVVLAPAANDAAHPAFSNLFVQTELVPAQEGILCHRRPREPDEACPWMFHMMAIHGAVERETSFETDRAAFIGRGNTAASPQAMQKGGTLGNSAGAVLDPVMAIRQRIRLRPGVPVIIDMVYGISDTRLQSLMLLEKYRDHHIADRVFEIAWSHSQVVLRQLNASEDDAGLFNRLAGALIFASQEMRGDAQSVAANRRGQSGLWGQSLSGDLPIVLLTMTSNENIGLVTLLIRAHHYWRLKGLKVDLVLLCNDSGGYQQALQNQILSLVASGAGSSQTDIPGGIFVRNGEQMTPDDRMLLMSVAHVVIDDRRGSLDDQLNQRTQTPLVSLPALVPVRTVNDSQPVMSPPRELACFNGLGGFSPDGREYQIVLNEGQTTPAPWSNVLANASFGTVISESAQAYTWYENAHEYRLTPWENDPVSDSSGEAFYLRDEDSGSVWSPAPLPVRGIGGYVTRHGFGYSCFEHTERGISSEMTVLVAEHAPVKLIIMTLTNLSGRPRRLSVTGYAEWVMADLRAKSAMHIVTSAAHVVKGCGVLATNHYTSNGSERTAFFAVTGAHCSVSGDRREFFGRTGSAAMPAAMKNQRLSDKTGAALDPCGAVQSATTLIDGDQRTFIFALGLGQNAADAEALIHQYLEEGAAQAELDRIHHHWHQVLDKIQITTPDKSVDLLANGWLIYQTLASRILARSGYYQSGGAFGFRDQLQDTLALSHAAPERMREQILLCASRQFIEGDVQHWWHPPTGNGVRTRCSDDYLWLPLAISHYITVTGDHGIAEESVPYLEARLLEAGEESFYEQPQVSATQESLWQHGVRALKHGLKMGEHGLPLMGAGDWNDGMNLVGLGGRGESVWLGFFLYDVLQRYGALAEERQDIAIATLCREQSALLKQNLNNHAWDGEWYLRGYFDSGETLGSHMNDECQIDAIAQSWSVLSGAGTPERTASAMRSVDQRLVDNDAGLIRLLTPPFDGNGPNPGYIRGYLPGVRENGGQYTHGAIWAVMAFARQGNTERAWELMSMINPINHSLTPEAVSRYKGEPYVISADIYSVDPHSGRAGWSWYTGSAGWTYRLITESLLGITRHGDAIAIHSKLPALWPEITVTYQQGSSRYLITVRHNTGDYCVTLDGHALDGDLIPLTDDGNEHQVVVELGSRAENA
ncbi:GH36-type glycosyl hydrolase domain-containing protein [Rahnella sp. GSA61A]|uniref:GH36-type glycosyl hydrolase domain-containing protein n=1 Tax=Rahnella sp. GSA61A TaxID=2862678 RepID=UPI001CBFFA22|nr:glucoamylase family protein [Rahnella sp. GSA61A]